MYAHADMSPDLIYASVVKSIVIAGVCNGNMNKAEQFCFSPASSSPY